MVYELFIPSIQSRAVISIHPSEKSNIGDGTDYILNICFREL